MGRGSCVELRRGEHVNGAAFKIDNKALPLLKLLPVCCRSELSLQPIQAEG